MEPRLIYLVLLEPVRASFVQDATDEELAIVGAHFEHLRSAHARGFVVLAGRADDGHPGIVVLGVPSHEAARELVDSDPAVRAGVFSAQLKPFRLALIGSAHAGDSDDDSTQRTPP